jgi:hypothetical protein
LPSSGELTFQLLTCFGLHSVTIANNDCMNNLSAQTVEYLLYIESMMERSLRQAGLSHCVGLLRGLRLRNCHSRGKRYSGILFSELVIRET